MTECKKVLIVEVDSITRAILRTFIEGKRPEWIVIEVENGYQALEVVDQQPIDFFIIDYHLPGLCGLNLIIELKRIHTPGKFVLLTAPLLEHLKTEIEVMAVEHLDKPITEKSMNAMLEYFES